MTITIAGISFDHHHYDESGAVIGITLLNVRSTLERDGQLTLSLPPEHLAADDLQPILAAA